MSNINSVLYRTKMLDDAGLVVQEWIKYFDTLGRSIVGYLTAGNNLSDLTNAATARTNLGLGSAATHPATDFQGAGASLQIASNLSDVASAATARTNLGLGTAATHPATDFQGAGTSLQAANNLSDVSSAATARTNLGLGSVATHAATDFPELATANTFASNQIISGSVTVGAGLALTGALTGALGGWQSWSPTLTSNGSGITSPSVTLAEYLQIGPLVFFNVHFAASFNGSDATRIVFTLPVAASNSGLPFTAKITGASGIALAYGKCSDIDSSHGAIYRDGGEAGFYNSGATDWFASGFYHA